jgi:hypothetical protein
VERRNAILVQTGEKQKQQLTKLKKPKYSDRNKIAEALDRFLPEGCSEIIAEYIGDYNVKFKISKPRQTKLGDYRKNPNENYHRISVNGDLNKYSFLVTTLHEFAHLTTFEKYGFRVKPHGKEWKSEFQYFLLKFINMGIFPEGLENALMNYTLNPKATSCSDPELLKELRKYSDSEVSPMLEELANGDLFLFQNRIFEKIQKRRTRVKCRDVEKDKFYLITAVAEVKRIQNG